MSTFKQEKIDLQLRLMKSQSLEEIAEMVVGHMYKIRLLEEETRWLDELANNYRDDEDSEERTDELWSEHCEAEKWIKKSFLKNP